MNILQPDGWPPPKGFANGILAEGRTVWVAGQIGMDPAGVLAPDLPAQVEQALRNIEAVLAVAGARPAQIVRLTWYMTDLARYEARLKEVGAAYRRVMGRHFPTMTVVEIARLVERRALVEIEATAVLP
ncbi:MAG TPA: RidA family protein [Stellaceae bacterium]|nr:RidA family protein [Stellaceae bacterium]